MAARAGSSALLGTAVRMGSGRAGQFAAGKTLDAAAKLESAAASGAARSYGTQAGLQAGMNMSAASSQNQEFQDGVNTGGMY